MRDKYVYSESFKQHVVSEFEAGTISYYKKVVQPVRIEFDVLMQNTRASFGVLFGNQGKSLDSIRRQPPCWLYVCSFEAWA